MINKNTFRFTIEDWINCELTYILDELVIEPIIQVSRKNEDGSYTIINIETDMTKDFITLKCNTEFEGKMIMLF